MNQLRSLIRPHSSGTPRARKIRAIVISRNARLPASCACFEMAALDSPLAAGLARAPLAPATADAIGPSEAPGAALAAAAGPAGVAGFRAMTVRSTAAPTSAAPMSRERQNDHSFRSR